MSLFHGYVRHYLDIESSRHQPILPFIIGLKKLEWIQHKITVFIAVIYRLEPILEFCWKKLIFRLSDQQWVWSPEIVNLSLLLNSVSGFCLRNRTTLRFDFLHSFMVCAQCFSSTRVAWWLINKNVISLLPRFNFASRLVFYLYICVVENPEIPEFRYYFIIFFSTSICKRKLFENLFEIWKILNQQE